MIFRIHTYWNVHEGWMLATSPGKSGSNWTLRMCCDVPTKLGTTLGALGTLGWDHCNTGMMVELGFSLVPRRFCRFLPQSLKISECQELVPIGSMVLLYMVTFIINIPHMLAYIPAPWILWDITVYEFTASEPWFHGIFIKAAFAAPPGEWPQESPAFQWENPWGIIENPWEKTWENHGKIWTIIGELLKNRGKSLK